MADPRFFRRAGPFALSELAGVAHADLSEDADPDLRIHDVATLAEAQAGEISFLDNRKYIAAFEQSRAAACIVEPQFASRAPEGMALLLTDQPYRAYAHVAKAFYPADATGGSVHPGAHISGEARLHAEVRVEAGAVIAEGVEIGPRSVVGANAVIGVGVVIGADCVIGANATLSHCLVGDRCLLHPGVAIGNRGFGFAMSVEGHEDIPQLGRVIIEDGVEIGANSTVDRGAGPDTVIGAGTKIDNLVQIGHNVRTGRGCVIVSQAGISGSTELGDMVIVAAQAGLTGHLKIGDGVRIAAQSGVMRDVEPGGEVFGSPAKAKRDAFRELVALERLAAKKDHR